MADLVLSCLESRVEDNRNLYARFLVGPFLKGEALTVATALRRVLLSSIESIGITALYIQGITHEFSTIVGVRESVLELSLNFQAIVLSYDKTFFQKKSFFDTIQIGYLQVQGPKVIYANHLKLPLGVKLVDPTQYIATVSKEGSIVLKFIIGKRMPSLHQNTGPESHFGNQARDLPIIGEVGKKSIDRAKKTCFYKKASTINPQSKAVSSYFLDRRMTFRADGKMYSKHNEKLYNLNRNRYQFKKESFSLPRKFFCVQLRKSTSLLAYKSAIWYPSAQSSMHKLSKRVSRTFTLVKRFIPFAYKLRLHAKQKKRRFVRTYCPKGHLSPILRQKLGCNDSFSSVNTKQFLTPNKVRSTLKESKCAVLFNQKNTTLGYKARNRVFFLPPLVKSRTASLSSPHCGWSCLQDKREKKKIFHQDKGAYGFMQSFTKKSFRSTQGSTKSSSLSKVEIVFRKKKLFFKKYKDKDKNDLKQKKFLFLSENKIFKSNICLRNVIPLDFTLTPVLKVNFVIEIDDEVLYLRQKVRERIIIEVWTNGSIHPRQALHDAALSLTDIFASFRSVYQEEPYF